MKKILITGSNSYIGTSFEKYINENFNDRYQIDTIDMIDDSWREKSFVGYDCVFHVAGIAHQKETKSNKDLYYKVNRDLAVETAQKAKKDGVNQFVFLSTMSVYGLTVGEIYRSTKPLPKSNYGISKYMAELLLTDMETEDFIVSIIRPPMVYGKNCKGNYQFLRAFANRSCLFPNVNNFRSMIYIENLCYYIQEVVAGKLRGVHLPQNSEYVQTSKMVFEIARANNKTIFLLNGFNWLIKSIPVNILKKIFGTLIYKEYDNAGCVSFEKSIVDSEK